MKCIKSILIVAFCMVTLYQSSNINAAEVRSISREIPMDGATTPSWEVSVECAGVTEKRIIQRVGKSGKWCSADFSEVCLRKKVKIAKKVCGTHFGKRLESSIQGDLGQQKRPDKVMPETKLTNEEPIDSMLDSESGAISQKMIDIEQQKILIEQKRLELKLKEIKLKKKTASTS